MIFTLESYHLIRKRHVSHTTSKHELCLILSHCAHTHFDTHFYNFRYIFCNHHTSRRQSSILSHVLDTHHFIKK